MGSIEERGGESDRKRDRNRRGERRQRWIEGGREEGRGKEKERFSKITNFISYQKFQVNATPES